MLRHEYKCLFAYFRNLFIEIFRIVMFILIFYPLELHKYQHDCHTKNNTKAMNAWNYQPYFSATNLSNNIVRIWLKISYLAIYVFSLHEKLSGNIKFYIINELKFL